ncbi:MAG: DUF72 domain-containing protein [Acidobacteria bacterium]|nr:DUF72 domain-containing protein [Acidobacteriota bacterium]
MTGASQGILFEPPPRDTRLRVGPAGWSYEDWKGVVYPAERGRSFDPLRFLADFFDTIEINSSFYAPARPQASASWARRVRHNPRFRFTAKAWQRLSHERKNATRESVAADCRLVRSSLAPLAEAGALGAVLIQFPWSFRHSPENLEYLALLRRELRELPLVVEVRHGSWDRADFYAALREQGIAFCNVDQPVIGESLKPAAHVTARIGYFRMHGRNYRNWFQEGAGRDARYDYLYTREEVGQIAKLIRTVRQEAEETYAITNNHFRGQALVNAIEILEELDVRPPAVPQLLAEAYPRLKDNPRA